MKHHVFIDMLPNLYSVDLVVTFKKQQSEENKKHMREFLEDVLSEEDSFCVGQVSNIQTNEHVFLVTMEKLHVKNDESEMQEVSEGKFVANQTQIASIRFVVDTKAIMGFSNIHNE